MFLEHLKVNNFRQLEDVDVCFNETLTFIAGGNNSGKTSLLDIMNFAFSEDKDLTYEDMSLSWLEKMLKALEEKVQEDQNINNHDEERIHLFRDYLIKRSSDFDFNIQIFYTLAIEDQDDLRYVGDYIIAVEDDLKLHFLVQYGLSEQKIKTKQDVVERLYNHILSFDSKPTQSDYAHSIDLLNHLSSKKISYCSCKIDDHGYHYPTEKEKLYDINRTHYRKFIQTQFIPAQKNLGEYEASEKSLNRLIIDNVSQTMPDWDQKILEITDEFREKIGSTIKSDELDNHIQYLNEEMVKYQKLNGNQKEDLSLVFTHTYQAVEEYLEKVWNLHTKKSDDEEAYTLPNSKQGLGFNHLLYIYFYIEMMKAKSQDNHSLFNLLLIEEPENHMHPHMQQMLVRYLYEAQENLNFQIILTTHSSDIVKNLEIEDIRVLKKEKNKTQEYDLSVFMKDLDADKKKFYEKFFGVTMYPLIFSDKAIFYEGDTERLFFETILSRTELLNQTFTRTNLFEKRKKISKGYRPLKTHRTLPRDSVLKENKVHKGYSISKRHYSIKKDYTMKRYSVTKKHNNFAKEIPKKLRSSYISLIQVSGDYAHRYFDFVDYLDIRTVVFTDIDYAKKFNSLDEIKKERKGKDEWKKISSNSVLRTILDLKAYESVQELFNLMQDGSYVEKVNEEFRHSDRECSIKVFTQTLYDGYARTLEDAMLFNYLRKKENLDFQVKNVFCELSKNQWSHLSKNDHIKIPNIGAEDIRQSIRKRVETGLSSSSKKTDFMYSFLLQEDEDLASAVPRYVCKGLKWLVSEE